MPCAQAVLQSLKPFFRPGSGGQPLSAAQLPDERRSVALLRAQCDAMMQGARVLAPAICMPASHARVKTARDNATVLHEKRGQGIGHCRLTPPKRLLACMAPPTAPLSCQAWPLH